jgi:hypothetical protein
MNKKKTHTEPPEHAATSETAVTDQAVIPETEPPGHDIPNCLPEHAATSETAVTDQPVIPEAEPLGHNIPNRPPENPMQGDKTPEVVAWWFKYHPAKAALKYAGRQFQHPLDHE